MPLDIILPNGATINFDSEAEAQAYINSMAGSGAQDQNDAVAQNPGQTIQQIASDRGAAWNAPGGQGYADAMAQGHNDPTSNPANPTPFTPTQLTNAGINPQAYYDSYAQQHYNSAGGVTNWGINPDREAVNRAFYEYLVAQGYSPDISAFGGGQFQQWLQYQPTLVQNDARSWLANNDPRNSNYGGAYSLAGGGGLLGGGQSSGGGGLLGGGGGSGGMGGGTGSPSMAPISAAPIYQNVGNVAGAANPNPLSVSPTIPSFQQPPQSFADLLSEYGAFQAPLLNNGINWMTPSVTPGAINIMNANLSRRPL